MLAGIRILIAASLGLCVTGCANDTSDSSEAAPPPRNIIVLIADGAGYNTLRATRLWTGQPLPFDNADWISAAADSSGLRVFPAKPRRGEEGLEQDQSVTYDSARAWDVSAVEGMHARFPAAFAGYQWTRAAAPDSANTMTAMMTGVRTYNSAINVDGNGAPLLTVPEVAKLAGKSVGVVSTVPFNHATVAAGAGAHHFHRKQYHDLADEMFTAGVVDVIAGGGHPAYDHDGERRDEPDYTYINPTTWSALQAGELRSGDATDSAWIFTDDVGHMQQFATTDTPPKKLAMIARTAETMQQLRRSSAEPKTTKPGDDPRRTDVPTLSVMTQAALNVLDENDDGFFLMAEGGAVDWAMHDNQLGRMIEEYLDFLDAFRTVAAYLDANTNGNNWNNTLVVVTADHDHLLFGPDAATIPFQPVVDKGSGELPGHRWLDDEHSNQLVPLFVRGPGAEQIAALADEIDEHRVGDTAYGRGAYLRQNEIGAYLLGLFDAVPGRIQQESAPAP